MIALATPGPAMPCGLYAFEELMPMQCHFSAADLEMAPGTAATVGTIDAFPGPLFDFAGLAPPW